MTKQQTRLKKELRDKLPQYVIDLLEQEDIVKFIKKYPGARLLNAKQQQHKKER
jgi:hypothetical protein|tara:strand:+ start:2689 stop:2850 length:162 start_codon:yes stop_codon:yes gene_type:complete